MSTEKENIRDLSDSQFPDNGNLSEQIKFLLRYAILAPSTHNIQPWLFKVGKDFCELYLNSELYLPEGDKNKRNAHISLGCCLENLIIAGKYYGIYDRHEYSDDFDNTLVAKVYFKKGLLSEKELKKYIEAIKNRVNARGPFLPKDIDEKILNSFVSASKNYEVDTEFITDKSKISKIAEITEKAMSYAHSSPAFRQEMSLYINNSLSPKKQGMHGYSMGVPFLVSFFLPKIVKHFNTGRVLGKLNYKSISSAPMIAVISAEADSKIGLLETGRMAQSIMLQANINGLKSSVYIAGVEMGDFYKQFSGLLQSQKRPQFMLCVGYMAGKYKPTPRHGVGVKLIK